MGSASRFTEFSPSFRLVQAHPDLLSNPDVVSRVTGALLKGEFHEQAGELYERVDQVKLAQTEVFQEFTLPIQIVFFRKG